jgi:hypothetical protein
MAEPSMALILDGLEALRDDVTDLRIDVCEALRDIPGLRSHVLAMQQDIVGLYGALARHEVRLDRLERRAEPRD